MKIKITTTMDYDDFIAIFAEHYEKEKSCAWEYLGMNTDEKHCYHPRIVRTMMIGMDYKFYDLKLALEKYIHEENKINYYNITNLIAFGLTLKHFEMENAEILS